MNNLGKINRLLLIVAVLIISAFFLIGCDKGAYSGTIGVFTFDFPEHYNEKPDESKNGFEMFYDKKDTSICLSVLETDLQGYDYSVEYEGKVMQQVAKSLGAELEEDDSGPVKMSSDSEEKKVKGAVDIAYDPDSDKTFTVLIVQVTAAGADDKDSKYDFEKEVEEIIGSVKANGKDVKYYAENSFGSDYGDSYDYDHSNDSNSDYDDWDTDNNEKADWHDVDTDNDGNVSKDEMDKYLDDWKQEEKGM